MTQTQSKFTVVSLFSGAGGFDWGFHRTGRFETRIACELLPNPAATLAQNLGLKLIKPAELAEAIARCEKVAIQGDVAEVNFSQFNIQPDVLIGGPPCQDFSITIAKKAEPRPGLNGGRGKLYVEFVRAVMFLQPKMFVFENVPGLLSANEGQAIITISNDLQNLEANRQEAIAANQPLTVPDQPICNYKIIFQSVINGPDIGVPQTRRRLIIMGLRCDLYDSLTDDEQRSMLDAVQTDVSGKASLFSRFPLTCLEIFEGLPLTYLQTKYSAVMQEYTELAHHSDLPLAKQWRENVWDRLKIEDIRHDYFLANGIEDSPTNREDYEVAMQEHWRILNDLGWLGIAVDTLQTVDGTNMPSRLTNAVIERMNMIPPDENYAFVDNTQWAVSGHDISFIYRRAAPLKPAWTVMAYGGGGTYGYHYERERSQLTLRERARIQTFSDEFQFQEKGVRAQIGEAVPPLLAQRIAESIINIFNLVDAGALQETVDDAEPSFRAHNNGGSQPYVV